jgi:uncharacterized protein
MTTDQNIKTQLPPTARVGKWQVFLIVFILVAITICEYVFAYQEVAYGIGIGLALVIIIYILLSALHLDQRIVKSAESLALIPMYILFTSSLPWFFISQQLLLPAVYSCILALCFWYIYHNNISFQALLNFKKRKFLTYLVDALVIGIPTGAVEYLILQPEPSFPTFHAGYFMRDIVYMIFFVGLAEELLFRGLIQREVTNVFGWKWALIFTSVLFAVMHLTWRSIPELGFVFVAGMIMGLLYLKTKSLVAPILYHAFNNVMLVSIAPYLYAMFK